METHQSLKYKFKIVVISFWEPIKIPKLSDLLLSYIIISTINMFDILDM